MKKYTKLKKVYKFAQEFMQEHTNRPYHNFRHAMDVTHAVIKLAGEEGLSEKEKFLLVTASLLHDLVVEHDSEYNEELSIALSEQTLLNAGYSSEEASIVKKLVLATKVPMQPRNKMEEVLCDADLDNLGRADFFERSEEIRKELSLPEGVEWYEKQLLFLKKHKYHTRSAQKLRNGGLAENIRMLEGILEGEAHC